jgi:recombination protein RecT
MTQNSLQLITDDIYSVRDTFMAVQADRDINFEREAEFAIQAISRNDYSMRIASSARQSVIDAVKNIAAIGISLNPAKKQAYLVPRDGRICLDISYMGLLDIAVASGSIMWGQAKLVHEQDTFELAGYDQPPIHQYKPFGKDRGPVIGVYVVVKTHTGDFLTETMSQDEVNAIRDRSSAWKAWVKDKKSCPWVTDPGEMTKKTVIKRAYKTWPKTDRLDQAIHHLNTEGGEGLAELQPAPPAVVIPTELLKQAQDAAMGGVAAYEKFWSETGKSNRKLLAEKHEAYKAVARRADNPPEGVTDVEPKETAGEPA